MNFDNQDDLPPVRAPRSRVLLRLLLSAAFGALGFTAIGQIMAQTGGSCGLLCNPMASIPMGILVGVVSIGLGGRD